MESFNYEKLSLIVDLEILEKEKKIEITNSKNLEAELLHYGETKDILYVNLSEYKTINESVFDVVFRVDTINKTVEIVEMLSDLMSTEFIIGYIKAIANDLLS